MRLCPSQKEELQRLMDDNPHQAHLIQRTMNILDVEGGE